MVVEFNRENRMPLHKLFGDYPYLRACVAAVIEDGAGRAFADSLENPSAALAILDFQFLAGNPFHKSVPSLLDLLRPKEWLIAPTPDWQHVVSTTYPGKVEIYQRESFLAEQFDIEKLNGFISELPSGFELRKVSLDDVILFEELSSALTSSYPSAEDFIEHGVGMGMFHEGKYVSGASSSPLGGKKLEFEIQTHRQFRRRGFVRIVASALILYCLENGLEPCWDAANVPSSTLARQLGFCSAGKYNAFWLLPPDDKIVTS